LGSREPEQCPAHAALDPASAAMTCSAAARWAGEPASRNTISSPRLDSLPFSTEMQGH